MARLKSCQNLGAISPRSAVKIILLVTKKFEHRRLYDKYDVGKWLTFTR